MTHTRALILTAALTLAMFTLLASTLGAFAQDRDAYGFEMAPPEYRDKTPALEPLLIFLPFDNLQTVCSRGTMAHTQNRHYNGCTIPPTPEAAHLTYLAQATLIDNRPLRIAVAAAISEGRCVVLEADQSWLTPAMQQALYEDHEYSHCVNWRHPE